MRLSTGLDKPDVTMEEDSKVSLISVIVPVYNDPVGIRAALESLSEQRYGRVGYEIIVADNDSNDETADIIRRFRIGCPNLVRRVVERQIQSSYAARNQGIRAAQGEIIAFTDADCVPAPGWIAEGVRALREADAAFAAGRIEMTFRSSKPNLWEYLDASRKLDQQAYVEMAGFGATANLFVRREMFNRYGLFRSDLQSGGDYEFGRRLTKSGEKLIYAEKAVIRHPARSDFSSILEKSRRVAKGQRQLEQMGLLEHGALSWRNFVPVRRCAPMEGVTLSPQQRFGLILAATFFKYYNAFLRLT